MNTRSRLRFGLVLVLACPSCATIVNPGPDRVRITSRPEGAAVHVDDRRIGETPLVAGIERRALFVTFSHPGYHDLTFQVPRHVNPWAFGNVVVGFVGILVDWALGNEEKADSEIHGVLVPVTPSGPTG